MIDSGYDFDFLEENINQEDDVLISRLPGFLIHPRLLTKKELERIPRSWHMAYWNYFDTCMRLNDLERFKAKFDPLLHSHLENPYVVEGKPSITLLQNACYLLSWHIINFLLEQEEIDVNFKDEDGRTPLHFIASQPFNWSNPITQILKRDVDLYYRHDFFERLPLHDACRTGSLENVKALLEYTPKKKRMAMADEEYYQCMEVKDCRGETPLFCAIKRGFWETADYLLDVWKADINTTDREGNTPLYYLYIYNRLEEFKHVRSKGGTW